MQVGRGQQLLALPLQPVQCQGLYGNQSLTQIFTQAPSLLSYFFSKSCGKLVTLIVMNKCSHHLLCSCA
jgi:hypothetical protein